MMKRFAVAILAACLLATSASAQETDHGALRERALKVLEAQFSVFRDATKVLQTASTDYCDGSLSRDEYLVAFKDTWLAWAPLDSYQFGPIEQSGAVLSINFWPDKKGFVGRGLRNLLSLPPERQSDPQTVAAGSAAAQGFPAIEMLMFTDIKECPAIVGISGHMNAVAEQLLLDWFDEGGWADLARNAGPDNPVYLTEVEFTKVLYTAIDFGLTRIADTRLGRPLGSFDRPFPKRAEAWRSGLSLDIIHAQLDGIETLLHRGFGPAVFNPSMSWVRKVIADTHKRIDLIAAPLDQAVQQPQMRIRVEAAQTKVRYLQLQFDEDIGPGLGVETGFSAADGD